MIIRRGNESAGKVAEGTYIHYFVSGNDTGALGTPIDVYVEVQGGKGDYRLSVGRLS